MPSPFHHRSIEPPDPSTSPYWSCYTPDEQQMLIEHPIEDASLEIALLRSEIALFLKSQGSEPLTDPLVSLQTLYTIAVAARTIGILIQYQRKYRSTHSKWDALIEEGMHQALIRCGGYRHMASLGFEVPEGVLDIEPDLLEVCPPIPGWVPPDVSV